MHKLFKKCLNHYVLYLKMLLSSIKINPYQNLKLVIHDIKPQANQSSQKLIYLRYFDWRLFTMKKNC